MKAVLKHITTAIVAAQAVAAFGAFDETSVASAPPTAAQVESAPETSTKEAFESAAAEINRAARENDLDAMRAVVDAALENDALTVSVKAQLVETLCAAQIKELAKAGDEAALKAFCDDFLAKAVEVPAYAGAARTCARLVEIYNPRLGAEFQRTFKDSVLNSTKQDVKFAAYALTPPFASASAKFDESLLKIEPKKDLNDLRAQLAQLEEATRTYNKQAQKASTTGTPAYQETSERIDEARFKLLREIVLFQDDDARTPTQDEFQKYDAYLFAWSPEKDVRNSTRSWLDQQTVEKAIQELANKDFSNAFFITNTVKSLESAHFRKIDSYLFHQALNGETSRSEFLKVYRERLDAAPKGVQSAINFVLDALKVAEAEFAQDIVRVVEDYQKAAPDDMERIAYLAAVQRVANVKDLDSLVGQKIEFSGVDVNFNEAPLDSTKGKYVLLAVVPKDEFMRLPEIQDRCSRFEKLARSLDPEKFAAVEYIEAVGHSGGVMTYSNLRNDDIQKSLAEWRAKPFPVIAQDLSIVANVAYGKSYPALFRSYRVLKTQFALIDPDGVLISVDKDPRDVQRRIQLMSIDGFKSAQNDRQDARR